MRDYLDFTPAVIEYRPRFHEYVLPIYDGPPDEGSYGGSGILISNCPWCGAQLPESIRMQVLADEDPA
jgi:hypothetical protein